MERLEDPEKDQGGHNLGVVLGSVLVDTLIVGLVDLVVAVSVSGELRGRSFFSVCVDGVLLHTCLLNGVQSNKLIIYRSIDAHYSNRQTILRQAITAVLLY